MTNEEVSYELETNVDYKTPQIQEACQTAIKRLALLDKIIDEISHSIDNLIANDSAISGAIYTRDKILSIIDRHLKE